MPWQPGLAPDDLGEWLLQHEIQEITNSKPKIKKHWLDEMFPPDEPQDAVEVTDEMLAAGLEEALKVMDENGVDGLSPFTDYPSPSETMRRVFIAMSKAGAGR